MSEKAVPSASDGREEDAYTYRVTWSPERREHLCSCAELPALTCVAATAAAAEARVRELVAGSIARMRACGHVPPIPLRQRRYSGEFRVRISADLHRDLTIEAAEQGISLNQLANLKLAA